jgi:hypothetical protein
MKKHLYLICILSLVSLFAGCGGGGNSASSATSNTSPNTTSTFNNTTSSSNNSGTPQGSNIPGSYATGDTVTVTNGSKTITYNEINVGGAGALYNPAVYAGYYTSKNQTIIGMIQDGATCALTIVTPGSTTGTYTVGNNGVSVKYNDFYNYTSYFTAISGTVNVTSYGAVNGLVQGTFDVTATNQTTGATTYHLTGSFKTTRIADQ